jgi:hypothetical protein
MKPQSIAPNGEGLVSLMATQANHQSKNAAAARREDVGEGYFL